jgi:hypothetical protein
MFFFLLTRARQMLDYDASRSKLNKIIMKPSEDPTKLPKVDLRSIQYLFLEAPLLIFFAHARLNKNTTKQRKSSISSTNN